MANRTGNEKHSVPARRDADYTLFFQDVPVLSFNRQKGKYVVENEDFLPCSLRGAIVPCDETAPVDEQVAAREHNWGTIVSFLSRRVLNFSRSNAKKLYNAVGFPQSQDPENRAKIAMYFRAVSATDSWWIDRSDTDRKYADVNVRKNKLSKTVIQIALLGSSLTIHGMPHTPEYTNRGSFAQSWRRIKGDPALYLYKKNSAGGNEAKIEECASKILACLGISHVEYRRARSDPRMCYSKNMADESRSVIPAMEIMTYCENRGLDFKAYAKSLDRDMVNKTLIADYLLANPDRHEENWGFYMDNATGRITGCHPLFDHNLCFDRDLMRNPDSTSRMFGDETVKEAAENAMRETPVKMTRPVTRDMFPDGESYRYFTAKCRELGIKAPAPENGRSRGKGSVLGRLAGIISPPAPKRRLAGKHVRGGNTGTPETPDRDDGRGEPRP